MLRSIVLLLLGNGVCCNFLRSRHAGSLTADSLNKTFEESTNHSKIQTGGEPAQQEQFHISDIMNKKHSLIQEKPTKIAVISQCGGPYYQCDEGTWTKSFRNHQDYARKHGYEYFLLEKPLSKRLKVWDRFPVVSLLHNRGAEWVLYLDADALFMNTSVNVEDFIEKHGSSKDLIVSGDGNVNYQAGVYLMRKSSWALKTMCKAWKVCPSPGWEELGAMMTVLGGGNPKDSSTWGYAFDKLRASGVTEYDQHLALQRVPEETEAHLALLPQRAMDSYSPEAVGFWPHENPADIQYAPGDWIIHLAGLTNKEHIVRYRLPEAQLNIGHSSRACSPEFYVPPSAFDCTDV